MKIQESAENYLEAILVLMQKNGQVRSIDVAHYTGFSKPSISRAVGLLRDNGYVSIDQNGLLGLTESGLKIAETIYERHTVLTSFLTALGVDSEIAAEDACRIEHVISQESFEKIRAHVREMNEHL
ncbi:metal-dependent transcriptional regulator [Hominenteromicrobium sp.]|uniref:metal-dependent transcriptional regulator n=1 Tax=Hominenteromicrobium sp. TaxID=3073581 RepID=UPI003AB23E9D